MPKPSILATWASALDYPADAAPEASTPTKVAPTTGQATIGWRPDQIPTAQEENYWKNAVGQWIAYLNSGVYDGNLEVDGNLHVTGTSTLDGGITNNVALTAGATAAVNQDIAISGTGRFKHGNRTTIIDMMPFAVVSAGGVSWGPSGAEGISATEFYVRLPPFPDNTLISTITFYVDNGGPNVMNYSIYKLDNAGTTSATGITANGAGTVVLTCDLTISSSYLFMIRVDMGSNACTFIQAKIVWSTV